MRLITKNKILPISLVCISLSLVATFSIITIQIGSRVIEYDKSRSFEWRRQVDVDDAVNGLRLLSIIDQGYADNKILPVGLQSFHYFLAENIFKTVYGANSKTQSEDERHFRAVNLLRWKATIFTILSFLSGMLLFWRLFGSRIGLVMALVWAAGFMSYFYSLAFKAKEDALCLFIVVLFFLCVRNFIVFEKSKHLMMASILVGLGASTKQYPLLLMPIVMYLCWKFLSRKDLIKNIFLNLSLTGIFFVIGSPNYFLQKKFMSTDLVHYYASDMMGSSPFKDPQQFFIDVLYVFRTGVLYHVWPFLLIIGISVLSITFFSMSRPEFAPKGGRGNKFHDVIVSLWPQIVIYLVFYYATSLWKQHQYNDPKYFLAGELVIAILSTAVLARAFFVSKYPNILLSVVFAILIFQAKGAHDTFLEVVNRWIERVLRSKFDSSHLLNSFLLEKTRGAKQKLSIVSEFYTYIDPKLEVENYQVWGVSWNHIHEKKPDFVVINSWGLRFYRDDKTTIYPDLLRGDYKCLRDEYNIDSSEPDKQKVTILNFLSLLNEAVELKTSNFYYGYKFKILSTSLCQ